MDSSGRGCSDVPQITNQELKQLDGSGESGRICVAVKGKVYEINETGRHFYMPGGPYAMFAGRDASRGLATMTTSSVSDQYDSLLDLTPDQRDSLDRWDKQFAGKYNVVAELKKT